MTETKDAETTVKPKKAAAKPKSAAKATATKATTAKKPATGTRKPAAKKTKADAANPEHHYRMVEVAAYYLAEKDGFAGNPVDYWIAAEMQISKQ